MKQNKKGYHYEAKKRKKLPIPSKKEKKSYHYQAKKRRKQFTIIKPEAGGDMLAALQPQSPPLSIKSSKKSEICKKM